MSKTRRGGDEKRSGRLWFPALPDVQAFCQGFVQQCFKKFGSQNVKLATLLPSSLYVPSNGTESVGRIMHFLAE